MAVCFLILHLNYRIFNYLCRGESKFAKANKSRRLHQIASLAAPTTSTVPGNTASSSGASSAPPANQIQLDFRMETVALSPRVMAPVWDRRVITPRSGGEGGNRNRRQKLHQPLLMLLPSISLSSVLNV